MSAFQRASVSANEKLPKESTLTVGLLSVERIELNFPQISQWWLVSALLCCVKGLSDYHTIRKNVEERKKKSNISTANRPVWKEAEKGKTQSMKYLYMHRHDAPTVHL